MAEPAASLKSHRRTSARARVLAALSRAVDRGRPYVPLDRRDVVWVRKHAVAEKVVEVAPRVFYRQREWGLLNRRERSLVIIKGLAGSPFAWGFWCYDAALVWGLEVPYELLDGRYLVTANIPTSIGCPVHLARRERMGPMETVDGVEVTSFWRTVEDCLLRAPFSYGLAVADSALRVSGTGRSNLVRRLSLDAPGRHGWRRAMVIASYANGLSENGGESRFRAFFIAYGFEVPELQVEFRDPIETERTFRVDYLWHLSDGSLLAGELDGKEKYLVVDGKDAKVSVEAFAAERQRESRLTLLGVKVLRFSFGELNEPAILIEKLIRAGVPRSVERSAEWFAVWSGADGGACLAVRGDIGGMDACDGTEGWCAAKGQDDMGGPVDVEGRNAL